MRMPIIRHTGFPLPSGGAMRGALAQPVADGRRRPGIIVIHEIFGLTEEMRRITSRLASFGYFAICPDLYDRIGARWWHIARTLWSQGSGDGPAWDALDGARNYLLSRSDVDPARIGVIGFSMGAGFALQYAQRVPTRIVGAFYGRVPNEADLQGVCPVFGGFGARDRLFAEHGRRLKGILEKSEVPHDVQIYDRVGHGYMSVHHGIAPWFARAWPLHAEFDPRAAEDSWRRLEAFLHRHLG